MHFRAQGGPLFGRQQEMIQAVNDVSFELEAGETLGLVGETGCGKSTVARCVVQLYRPTAGSVYHRGTDLTQLSRRRLRSKSTIETLILPWIKAPARTPEPGT